MWVCRNVIGTTLMFDGLKFVPPIKNGDEWGMVYGIAIPTLIHKQWIDNGETMDRHVRFPTKRSIMSSCRLRHIIGAAHAVHHQQQRSGAAGAAVTCHDLQMALLKSLTSVGCMKMGMWLMGFNGIKVSDLMDYEWDIPSGHDWHSCWTWPLN